MSDVTPGSPPEPVRLAVMLQRWESVTFLHWPYPVEAVQRLLPPPLRVQPWDGHAWIGLLAFNMRIRPPFGGGRRALTFPETNLRTYVIGPDGRPGVWFLSLDAANAPAVIAARLTLGLPYVRAIMRVERLGDQVWHRSMRVRPGDVAASTDIRVVPGNDVAPSELTEFDHYLTARFMLWTVHIGRVMSVRVEHRPWGFRRAMLLRAEQDLTGAAGLPSPSEAPVVHYSDGVDARIGTPKLAKLSV